MSHDLDSMMPVFVISHDRVGSAVLLNRANDTPWPRPDLINVVVHERFEADYRMRYPRLTIHTHREPDGCGRARWAAARIAYGLGHERVAMLDDDVVCVEFKYRSQIQSGPNAGKESSYTSGAKETGAVRGFEQHVLAGAGAIAHEAFDDNPNAMIGGMIKKHMSFRAANHREKYVINSRVTPRQVMFWDLGRIFAAGLSLDQERFGWTGEDIGNVDLVLSSGHDCFALPSYVHDHWSEAINVDRSLVRNRETKREILDLDLENFRTLPIFKHLRLKYDLIGNYEWADVNWQSLGKERGVKPKVVLWDEAAVLDELVGAAEALL